MMMIINRNKKKKKKEEENETKCSFWLFEKQNDSRSHELKLDLIN